MEFGVLAGYPMVDMKFTLEDGAYHDVDSSEPRSRSPATRPSGGRPPGKPVLLEPMFAVEVTTPRTSSARSSVTNSRRGQIQAQEERHGDMVINALVPLSEMFGYVGDLRSKTSGPGFVLDGVRLVRRGPPGIADEIIKKVRGE